MEWFTAAVNILEKLVGYLPDKTKLTPSMIACVDRLMNIKGAHRVVILKVQDGGGALDNQKPMFLTKLYERFDAKYVTGLPELIKTRVDSDYKFMALAIAENGVAYKSFGALERGTLLYDLFNEHGSNYGEFYLIKKSANVIFFMAIATAEIETNPFENNKGLIKLEVNKLSKIIK